MYELIQTGEKSWYIDCPAKIGVYQPDASRVYLIDSGNDKDAGRKVRQILEKQGWTLAGILNTHSNADHIGGNRYLQGQTGCKVFRAALKPPLPSIRSWNRPFCTAVTPARTCGTNSF